jgi:hypothetical protein
VFGAACRRCPLRPRATASKTGRTLKLHPHDARLRRARRDWRDNQQLREVYRQQPAHGRTLDRLAHRTERPLPQLRYRGITAGDWWLHTRMAGLNLRRLLNLGLTRHAGTWTIA